MPKITLSSKPVDEQPKKVARVILIEGKAGTHRLVETKDGTLEYRVGVGKWGAFTSRNFITLVRSLVRGAQQHQLGDIALSIDPAHMPKFKALGTDWACRTLAENLVLASYEFTAYKSKNPKPKLTSIIVCGKLTKSETSSFKTGLTVGEAANTTRDIANQTATDMTPTKLGNAAKTALKGTKATVKVLSETEIKKLGMNLLFAVGDGTKEETKLIVIEYWGGGRPAKGSKNKQKQPIVLVGKGITYDTGGLNVKPSGAMHDMHLDMSGGAAVIGAIKAVAEMGLKKNVVGLIPAAENAVSDSAMRAGDIVTAMSGKTVEILHTDAEGRLVLADALTYSERYEPRAIIDIATLTGASLVALGQHASAIMTKDAKMQSTLTELGELSGDYAWPLPLWDEYQQYLKSSRADISNIATSFSRWGGVIEGGAFLANFAPKKVPWAHLDIAPRMEAIASDKLAKGSTGEPVRLLVRFIETY